MKALSGIKVVDISRGQHGPYAGAMLADMGADVIKVEPLGGEMARGAFLSTWYPLGTVDAFQLAHNRGKRDLAVDFLSPQGKMIIMKLLETCDVFLHNFRLGVTERLGMHYDAVSQVNPRIIYANAFAFGREGPLATMPALDLTVQAMGGIMSVTGEADGPPTPVGAAIADQVSAMMMAYGIVLALFVREKTGLGQEVDECMIHTMMAMQTWEITHYCVTGQLVRKAGRSLGLARGLWHIFRCADGKYIAVTGNQQGRWGAFCRAIEKEGWVDDSRFATAEDREQHQQELVRLLDEVFIGRTRQEWLDRLQKADQLVGPVWDHSEIVNNPDIEATGILYSVVHPSTGRSVKTVGPPVRLRRTPGEVKACYPELGEHTDEILREIGYSVEDIIKLKVDGIIH